MQYVGLLILCDTMLKIFIKGYKCWCRLSQFIFLLLLLLLFFLTIFAAHRHTANPFGEYIHIPSWWRRFVIVNHKGLSKSDGFVL